MLEIIGFKDNIKPCYYEVVSVPGWGLFMTSQNPHHKMDKRTCLLNPVLSRESDFLNVQEGGNIHLNYSPDGQSTFFDRNTEGFEYSYYLNPIIRTKFILNERGHIIFPFITQGELIPTSQVQALRYAMRLNNFRLLENRNIEVDTVVSTCNGKMSLKFEELGN